MIEEWIKKYHRDNVGISLVSLPLFSSVQSLSRVRLFATAWIAARQASLSITNSRSSLRFTSIELVMPSSHLILCRPLLLLPPIPPSIIVFSNESTLHMRCPKYSTWMQSQKWQNDLCSSPRQTIECQLSKSMPQPATLKKLKLNSFMKTYKTF